MNKKAQRWIPAAVIPVVIAAAAIAIPSVADASPTLPEKSAQQVLELIATSSGIAYSGTVDQVSALGLPDVSALGSAGGTGGGAGSDTVSTALELLAGSHSARVFVGGATTQRVQVLDSLAERDAVRNGDSVWLYDSHAKKAVHVTGAAPADLPSVPAITPAEAATKLLATIDSSTKVTVVDTARVAGRDAYQLRLTPKATGSLVGDVTLSVDAKTGLPLAASITAAGKTDPAFSVGFSSISFDTPKASLFDFTPPSDAQVSEKNVTSADLKASPDAAAPKASSAEPTVIGTGWSAIVTLPAGKALPAGKKAPADQAALLNQLTQKVDGGRALSTALLSVLLTDDGRVFAGAVSVAQLQAAAAR